MTYSFISTSHCLPADFLLFNSDTPVYPNKTFLCGLSACFHFSGVTERMQMSARRHFEVREWFC
jgi:hypothetical protein